MAHALAGEAGRDRPLRAVTISRETGAGAVTVGKLLADYLEGREAGLPHSAWAVFDRELVKMVLRDHGLPAEVERYMPEDASGRFADAMEEVLGLHPSSWTLVQSTNHTIRRLALAGNVILVGRGAHLVAGGLRHVLHIRLVAPLDFRVRHIQEYYQLNRKQAEEFVRKGDQAKARYVRRNFESRVQDPLSFHLTINTGRVNYAQAARIIGDVVLNMRIQ